MTFSIATLVNVLVVAFIFALGAVFQYRIECRVKRERENAINEYLNANMEEGNHTND